jgi:hypothetical protein
MTPRRKLWVVQAAAATLSGVTFLTATYGAAAHDGAVMGPVTLMFVPILGLVAYAQHLRPAASKQERSRHFL